MDGWIDGWMDSKVAGQYVTGLLGQISTMVACAVKGQPIGTARCQLRAGFSGGWGFRAVGFWVLGFGASGL